MQKGMEFCLIVEGNYETVDEAKHALIAPFLEDYIEETGKFKIHNFDVIRAASGISLGDLEIVMIDGGMFEISCRASPNILNRRRAEQLAETLTQQAMFEEVRVEPLQ